MPQRVEGRDQHLGVQRHQERGHAAIQNTGQGDDGAAATTAAVARAFVVSTDK